jgi:hypothetical protein
MVILTKGLWLAVVKTQKQVSYGLAHAQRDPAPAAVLFTVVKHMATLAKGLQISQPVVGGIMRWATRHTSLGAQIRANFRVLLVIRPNNRLARRPP